MKSKHKNIQAIIFDMDGVITDTMPYHYRAWKKTFKNYGLSVSKQEIYAREGQKGIQSVLDLFKEHGKTLSAKSAQKILQDKEILFKRIAKQRFITGARSFIKAAYRKNIRLALVTGTSRHETMRILPKYIFQKFEVTVCASDVKHGKPHPEPYLKALKALHLKKDQVIVLENAPFGIISAKKARLQCLAITTSLPKTYLKQADLIFNTFNQIKEYLYV